MAQNQFDNMWTMLLDIGFVTDDETNKEYLCTICKKIMMNVHYGPCGCTYCHDCIRRYLDGTEKLCPGGMDSCQDVMLNIDRNIHVDHRMNTKIMKLVVRCPHRCCEYRGQMQSIPDHLRIFNHEEILVKCPYCDVGCKETEIMKEEMGNHLLSELFPHSQLLIERMNVLMNEMTLLKNEGENVRNENVCLKEEMRIMKMNCERGNEEMRVMNMENDHRDETRRILVLELQTSLAERQLDMERLKESYQQSQVNLKAFQKIGERNKVDLRMAENKIFSLERQLNELAAGKEKSSKKAAASSSWRDVCGEFVWEGDQWCHFMDRDKFDTFFSSCSSPFHTNDGYKMCLELYYDRDDVRINACIMGGPNDDKLDWPFTHDVTLEVINRKTGAVFKWIKLIDDPRNYGRKRQKADKFAYIRPGVCFDTLESTDFLNLCRNRQLLIKCTISKNRKK